MTRHLIRAAAMAALIFGTAAPLAAQADPLADGISAFNAKDYPTALRLLSPLAGEGDASAEFHLGLMRLFGLGVAQDADAARVLNRQAAEQGYQPARQLFAAQCLDPDEGDAECQQAIAWLRADADAGNVEDQTSLGAMYLLGRGGLTKNPATAVLWFRRAAERGDARAQAQLGAIYATGMSGVPADRALSLAWYRKAAAQGDPDAER